MIKLDQIDKINSSLQAHLIRYGTWFNRLDNNRKWLALSAALLAVFMAWRLLLQNTLADHLQLSHTKSTELSAKNETISQQIERFEQLKAASKLVLISEYQHQKSGRVIVSANLGQWGQQCGLFLDSSEQIGDEVILRFTGTYNATLRFVKRLTNAADGRVAFKDFSYQVNDEQMSGGVANISLRLVLKR